MEGKEALQIITDLRTDQVVVTTMSSSREWPSFSKRVELDLPLSGCMGKASSLGLGVALGKPDRQVLVLDGEGSLLMNLGSLVTIGALAPANLVHIVLDNDSYDTSGGQPTPGAGTVNLPGMATAAGYRHGYTFSEAAELREKLPAILKEPGPTMVSITVPKGWATTDSPSRKTPQALKEVAAALAG